MPADPSIYQMMQPVPRIRGPLEMTGQALQVRNLMGQGELQGLQRDQIRQQMEGAPAATALAAEKGRADISATQSQTTARNIATMRDLIAQARSDADMPNLRAMAQQLFPQTWDKIGVPDRFDPQWQMAKIRDADGVLKQIEAEAGRAVTVRGQDIGADTARRGQDIGAETARRGQDVTMRGQDVAATGAAARAEQEAAAKAAEENAKIDKTVNMYVKARDGLMKGLSGTETGPLAGRVPAVTVGQQIAEGGVAAMAPVLKQLFRVAGEGVFTDRDQALLLDMVPKRTDEPQAAAVKMQNIDDIVSAKLGRQIAGYAPSAQAPKGAAGAPRGAGGIRFLGFEGSP